MAKFAECDATYVVEGKLVDAPPGSFNYFTGGSYGRRIGLNFKCPCGCERIGAVRFVGTHDSRSTWEWDGNVNEPTVTPSIKMFGDTVDDEHWHGYLTAGRFVSV